jgi:hypothetical protein
MMTHIDVEVVNVRQRKKEPHDLVVTLRPLNMDSPISLIRYRLRESPVPKIGSKMQIVLSDR